MTAKRLAAFLILWIGLGGVCRAQDSFWQGSVPPTPEARRAQVREWMEGFQNLRRQIPTLSPAEQAWLKTEYDDQIAAAGGTFTKRALAAANSTEYQKREARVGLQQVFLDLAALDLSLVLRDRSQSSTDLEIALWTQLAADMIDPRFWQAVKSLADRKVVTGEINGSSSAAVFENHVMWARRVLQRVVLPLLDAKGK